MKMTKRRIENFSTYDCTGIANHLEKMAAKGWLLYKHSNIFWYYRRIEPKKLHFTVTYFPKASAFDPTPLPGQLTYANYCEKASWKLVTTFAPMQIFVSDEDSPVPIETDAVLQVQNMHKALSRIYLLYLACLIIGCAFIIPFTIHNYRNDPVSFLSSSNNLCVTLCYPLLMLQCMVEIGEYYLWYFKAKRSANQNGIFRKTHSHKALKYTMLTLILVNGLCLLISFQPLKMVLVPVVSTAYLVILYFIVAKIKSTLMSKNVSAQINRTITISSCFILSFVLTIGMFFLFGKAITSGWFDGNNVTTYVYRNTTFKQYHDDLPFALEDITSVNNDFYSTTFKSSKTMFLTKLKASQHSRLDHSNLPNLDYEIVKINFSPLYETCRKSLFDLSFENKHELEEFKYSYKEIDASNLDAEEVYQLYSGSDKMNTYLICWTDRIVKLTFSDAPTKEQIALATKKLKAA